MLRGNDRSDWLHILEGMIPGGTSCLLNVINVKFKLEQALHENICQVCLHMDPSVNGLRWKYPI
jgi:hypothetical protein